MKSVTVVITVVLLATMAMAGAANSRDVLGTAESNESLTMFVTGLRATGVAAMLKKDGLWTVFAPSNQAFTNMPQKDLEFLMANGAAMQILLAHYIVHGNIGPADGANLSSARTLLGLKLRTDTRSDSVRVNGAAISKAIPCTNGVLYTLDMFDPGLVREAIRAVTPTRPN